MDYNNFRGFCCPTGTEPETTYTDKEGGTTMSSDNSTPIPVIPTGFTLTFEDNFDNVGGNRARRTGPMTLVMVTIREALDGAGVMASSSDTRTMPIMSRSLT